MWSDERYAPFLLHAKPGKLTEEWFRWFVGAWNVARTIKDGRQGLVREYLDRDFRKELLKGAERRPWMPRRRTFRRRVEFTEAKGRTGLAADFTRLKGRILPLSDQARAAGSLRCAGAEWSPSHKRRTSAKRAVLSRVSGGIQRAICGDGTPTGCRLEGILGYRPSEKAGVSCQRPVNNRDASKVFDDYLMHSGDYLR